MTLSVLVFLVEDETLIQELVEHALQEGGFAVAKANSGKDAIAVLEADGAKFHALVSDINLGPGPTGWDVARRARELNEHLPVVYMTGGNGHEWASRRAEQHTDREAVRPGAICDGRLSASERSPHGDAGGAA